VRHTGKRGATHSDLGKKKKTGRENTVAAFSKGEREKSCQGNMRNSTGEKPGGHKRKRSMAKKYVPNKKLRKTCSQRRKGIKGRKKDEYDRGERTKLSIWAGKKGLGRKRGGKWFTQRAHEGKKMGSAIEEK